MELTTHNNTWNDTDSEDEYNDEEYVQNEVAPQSIHKDFSDNVLNVKHSLYDNIVLSPQLGTERAQSQEILQDYLNKLNDMYVMSITAQNGKQIDENTLHRFPENSRQIIRQTLNWIADYFSKNRIPDTIPYSDHIRKSFHDYQFVQDNSFE